MSRSVEYRAWQLMKNRCTNPNDGRWADYGGRGVKICTAWLNDFPRFYTDMGARPDGHSLDRINTDGNYEPANCRWATHSQQQRNRRDTKLTDHTVMQIRWLYLDGGFTQVDIAKAFMWSQGGISNIIRGRAWK